MKFSITISLVFFIRISSLFAASIPDPNPSFDITTDFKGVLKKVQSQEFPKEQIEKLKQYTLIYIYGMEYDITETLHIHLKNQIKPVKKWAKENGIELWTLGRLQDQDGHLPENEAKLKQIENFIEKAQKPILLLGHSKGGIDTLEVLLRRPDLWPKIAAYFPTQSPLWGTPLTQHPLMRFFGKICCGWHGEDLARTSIETRLRYMNEHKDEIDRLVHHLKIIALSGDLPKKPKPFQDFPFGWIRNYILRHGNYENDGLVPWKSSILPNAPYIHISGLSHAKIMVLLPGDRAKDMLQFHQALWLEALNSVNTLDL